jgi:hypothetical protein
VWPAPRGAADALVRRRLHPRHLPRLVAQATRVAARNPRVVRKLVRVTNRLKAARPSRYRAMGGSRRMGRGRFRAHGGMMSTRRMGSVGGLGSLAHRGVCPACGVRRRGIRVRGPVHLTIEAG